MIKNLSVIFFCFFSVLGFACPTALPTNHPNFCSSFKQVATCHCTNSGLPAGMCQNMNALYDRMIALFGSLKKACEYQKHTSAQNCIDNWNCYRLGGTDSQGRICSAVGKACQ